MIVNNGLGIKINVVICNQIHKYDLHVLKLFYYRAFYFTLGNLLPMYRSSLNHIYLVSVVKTKLIKTYTMNQILKPIVEDLRKFIGMLLENVILNFILML